MIGSPEYLHEYVSEKVSDWVSQVVQLVEFAVTQSPACYTKDQASSGLGSRESVIISVWLTVLPLREMGFNLNKRELRDAIKLRYD